MEKLIKSFKALFRRGLFGVALSLALPVMGGGTKTYSWTTSASPVGGIK